ncbi:uncharacterized protein ASPGLDRAFT_23400 [Aspergillus glaucus CBS 516.65]|uniref:Uncharacterized protein n=1 Tax=Aspergillus glaucus CBS 516.65 TaxID=1160497 RepID=A0A1L9VU08_ASPGL|nr:hypothetical protein ASPGLDRAFT_23400 [Aspergillus glaucus CBS 516.65]OJJ87384.1 hypothetical protein ASPGLDRAFT_23400 [Aspergillus glaucus CBS 516.65]
MFEFLFRPKTAEDWHAHLRRNPHPQKMLKCLLSDISLSDKRMILYAFLEACVEKRQEESKCTILDAFLHASVERKHKEVQNPKHLKYLAGTKKQSKLLWLESKLDDASHLEITQFIRFALFDEEDDYNDMDWCSRIIKADIKARWIVQREIYLNEEVQALYKSLSLLPPNTDAAVSAAAAAAAEAESQLNAHEKELRYLNYVYWAHKRHIWLLEAGTPVSAAGRAYEARRKHIPDWYLSEWLRRDCAGRGGCCGRGCECCERARNTRDREWSHGHCTSACGCCVRTRGRGRAREVLLLGPEEDMDVLPDDCGVSEDCQGLYVNRLMVAYIWGFGGFV